MVLYQDTRYGLIRVPAMTREIITDYGHISKPAQIPLDDVPELCRLLKIFANPNRLRILLFLLDREVSVGEIELGLLIKQPSLSHELKKLRDANLVTTKRQSKAIFYKLKNTEIKTLLISVRRALNQSKQTPTEQPQPMAPRDQDSAAFECGLFANIQQHPMRR